MANRAAGHPLGELKYLYVGTGDFDADSAFYGSVIGAERVWSFAEFGAHVAAFRVAAGPLFIIADHRAAPSCLPVFAVADIDATVADLKSRGWQAESGPFEIPDGPCYLFRDRSGNQLAVFGNVRPDLLSRRTSGGAKPQRKRAAAAGGRVRARRRSG
jgi:predicted enzyme related to lactoylglutathione lyase